MVEYEILYFFAGFLTSIAFSFIIFKKIDIVFSLIMTVIITSIMIFLNLISFYYINFLILLLAIAIYLMKERGVG